MFPKRTTERGAAAQSGRLAQAAEWAQRNSKLLIFLSSLVVVLSVGVIANHYWRRTRVARGFAEIARGGPSAALENALQEYADLPEVHSRMLLRLAEMKFEEGDLDKARDAASRYTELYPAHPWVKQARQILEAIGRDSKFLEEDRLAMVFQHTLYAHPATRSTGGSTDGAFGPNRASARSLEIETKLSDKSVRAHVELVEEDAPQAVARVLKLVETEGLKGATWERSQEGNLVRTVPAASAPPASEVPTEPSSLPVEAGAVMLVPREGGGSDGGRLQIALTGLPELEGKVSVIGYVERAALLDIQAIKTGDSIVSVRVEKGRPADRHGFPDDPHDH